MKLVCALMATMLTVTPALAQVRTGIDRLQDEDFATLKQLAAKHDGRLRLAVVTNPIGLDSGQRRTIDVLRQDGEAAVPGLKVLKLFSGEHGINAAIDGTIIDEEKDPASGLPIINLYGAADAQRHPAPRDLAGLDAVVIDLQDVGVRYWTFQTLMKYFLQDSVAAKLDVIVLDRPNPVGGIAVQGPLSTPGRESYVNPFPEPMRPGMTMGELASFFNGEGRIGAKLTVVKMTGWTREQWYDDTGLLWINPSPNLRSLAQATVYPGLALLEGVNVHLKGPSEPPFVRFGAPWIKATQLAGYLNARAIPGVKFMPVTYVPAGDAQYKYSGERVEGVEVIITERTAVDMPALGVEAVAALRKLYPDKAEIDGVDRLLLNTAVADQIKAGIDPRAIAAGWQADLNSFKAKRLPYLLYP